MAQFPSSTFSPREKENLAGVVYNPSNKKICYVEDIQSIENEVIAMQNYTLRDVVNTPATTGSMTVPMTSRIIQCTPTGNCTFNATGGVVGQLVTFLIYASGTVSRTITFGTNFIKQGTLATGTTNARYFAITFLNFNGSTWFEVKRTTAMS